MAGACWTAPVRAESERGSEMDSFAYTRNYDNIALFDKHTRRFTFILGDGGIYSYDAIKKTRKSLEYVGTPLENAFANIGRIGPGNAFSSGSEKVQVRVKLFFTDGTFTYGYVSKETVQKGSLQYHKEIAKAEKLQADKVHGENLPLRCGRSGLCCDVHREPLPYQGYLGEKAL